MWQVISAKWLCPTSLSASFGGRMISVKIHTIHTHKCLSQIVGSCWTRRSSTCWINRWDWFPSCAGRRCDCNWCGPGMVKTIWQRYHGSLVMSALNITQPLGISGLLDGYYKVMSNIPKWTVTNPWVFRQVVSKSFTGVFVSIRSWSIHLVRWGMTYMLLAWCLYPWAQLSNISKCS